MRDLRQISLCNVVYKILSKVLSNCLKEVLLGLVDKVQSAPVSGKAIQDNVLIAFEIIHAMKNMRSGRRGDMATKIDINKVCGRVDWNYLESILYKLGFSERWVGWMMLCVRYIRYSIQVNNDMVGPIILGPCLRQGYPLAPYLFILYTKGLLVALNHAYATSTIHGNKVCREVPESLTFCG